MLRLSVREGAGEQAQRLRRLGCAPAEVGRYSRADLQGLMEARVCSGWAWVVYRRRRIGL